MFPSAFAAFERGIPSICDAWLSLGEGNAASCRGFAALSSARKSPIGGNLSWAAGSSPLGGGGLEQGGGQEGGVSNSHKRLDPEVLPEGGAPS